MASRRVIAPVAEVTKLVIIREKAVEVIDQ
jgi:hypothetical protein